MKNAVLVLAALIMMIVTAASSEARVVRLVVEQRQKVLDGKHPMCSVPTSIVAITCTRAMPDMG